MNQIYARGYISSGTFRKNRVPQHVQNQIIRDYCDANLMKYVLSRAEYWFNEIASYSQLWAALNEGNTDLVFYSVWQLPEDNTIRRDILSHCIENKITLHFACERLRCATIQEIENIELLNSVNSSLDKHEGAYLNYLNNFISKD